MPIKASDLNCWGSLKEAFFNLKTNKKNLPEVQCINSLAIDEDNHHLLSEIPKHFFIHTWQWFWMSFDKIWVPSQSITGNLLKDSYITLIGLLTVSECFFTWIQPYQDTIQLCSCNLSHPLAAYPFKVSGASVCIPAWPVDVDKVSCNS